MKRSHKLYRLVAVLSGLALAIPALSAAADTQGSEADWWPSVPCATGGFTDITASWNGEHDPPVPVVRFKAWIRPCEPIMDDRARFAFTLYTDDGYRGQPRKYSRGDSTTTFVGILDYGDYVTHGRPRAVCVSYDPGGRAACVELDTIERGLPAGVPISVFDPRVTFLVTKDGRTDPTCGTCL